MLRTSDPDIYAAGDVASALNPLFGERLRVEHWANASNQGKAAGLSMAGQGEPYAKLPYFFTDQYDLGMEYHGWVGPDGYDDVVLRGDPESGEWLAFWLAGGRVLAGMTVNVWDQGDPVKAMARARTAVDRTRLADPDVPLHRTLVGGLARPVVSGAHRRLGAVAGRIRDEDVVLVKERGRHRRGRRRRRHPPRPRAAATSRACAPSTTRSPRPSRSARAWGSFHCFGCQEGGDAISFVMKIDHLTFAETVERLAARYGITLRYEEGGPATRPPARRAHPPGRGAQGGRAVLRRAAGDPGGGRRPAVPRRARLRPGRRRALRRRLRARATGTSLTRTCAAAASPPRS